jgi:hypothetical protein
LTQTSDRRFKENIIPITSALSIVSKLNGYRYTRNDEDTNDVHVGFVAQEVKAVLPEVVTYDKGKDIYAISYGNVTAVLVEAIKDITKKEVIKTQNHHEIPVVLHWDNPQDKPTFVLVKIVQQYTIGNEFVMRSTSQVINIQKNAITTREGIAFELGELPNKTDICIEKIDDTSCSLCSRINNFDEQGLHSITVSIKHFPKSDTLNYVFLQ